MNTAAGCESFQQSAAGIPVSTQCCAAGTRFDTTACVCRNTGDPFTCADGCGVAHPATCAADPTPGPGPEPTGTTASPPLPAKYNHDKKTYLYDQPEELTNHKYTDSRIVCVDFTISNTLVLAPWLAWLLNMNMLVRNCAVRHKSHF